MTNPTQMGDDPRAETAPAPQQGQTAPQRKPLPAAGADPPAAPQMGAPLFRDWAAI